MEKQRPVILYVEDERARGKDLAILSENLDFQLECAKDSCEATRLFSPGKYDMILMDVCLPIMENLQTIRELKNKFNGYLPPVIALSENISEQEVDDFVKFGMDELVASPITNDKLEGIITKYLENKS